jgi:hypothetical protein
MTTCQLVPYLFLIKLTPLVITTYHSFSTVGPSVMVWSEDSMFGFSQTFLLFLKSRKEFSPRVSFL